MIPGSISKLVEEHITVAATITVKADMVLLHGNGVINTIHPGVGTGHSQLLFLVPDSTNVVLGNTGNVSSGVFEYSTFRRLAIKLAPYRTTVLMFSKFYQMWIVVAGAAENATVPVNYWKLDELGGNIAKDTAGTADGVMSGGISPGQPGAVLGTSFLFDGVSGKIMVDIPLPPIAASVTAWIKTTSLLEQPIFSSRMPGSPEYTHVYLGTNAGKVLVSTDQSINSGIKLINDNQWHHVALVFFGITCVVYIDGTYDSSFAVAPRGGIWHTGAIGWDGKNNEFWNGSLDDIAIWPFGLNPQTVNELYEQGIGSRV